MKYKTYLSEHHQRPCTTGWVPQPGPVSAGVIPPTRPRAGISLRVYEHRDTLGVCSFDVPSHTGVHTCKSRAVFMQLKVKIKKSTLNWTGFEPATQTDPRLMALHVRSPAHQDLTSDASSSSCSGHAPPLIWLVKPPPLSSPEKIHNVTLWCFFTGSCTFLVLCHCMNLFY